MLFSRMKILPFSVVLVLGLSIALHTDAFLFDDMFKFVGNFVANEVIKPICQVRIVRYYIMGQFHVRDLFLGKKQRR